MNIKICVCHSPNNNNVYLNNDIYLNVVGGSYRCSKINDGFIRDDQGDNISHLNQKYNELTVQYWAWKNLKADYYGFCHYRRFLSFTKKRHKLNERNFIVEDKLDNNTIIFNNLLDKERISKLLQEYDCIVPKEFSVKNIITPKGYMRNVEKHYLADYSFFDYNILVIVLEIIQKLFPKYLAAYKNYLKSNRMICHNCFIFKKQYFDEFEAFQFGVLFEVEKRINMDKYGISKLRCCGYISEILNATFIYYLKGIGIKIYETPILFINKTEKKELPEKKNDYQTFIFSANNRYVPYLSVALISFAYYCNNNNKYEIIIMNHDITNKNKEILQRMLENYKNINLIFFDTTYYINKEDLNIFFKDLYSEEVYFRLLSPFIFTNREKAVMCDSDIVFNKNFGNSFDFELNKECIGGVKDLVYQGMLNNCLDKFDETKNKLNLEEPYNYINAGFFFANFSNIRNKITYKDLVNLCRAKFDLQDQDVLNKVFNHNNSICFLNPEFNLFNESNIFVKKMITDSVYSNYVDYLKARKNPLIIHYANNPKPWVDITVDLGDKWWKFAKLTPYYEELFTNVIKNYKSHERYNKLKQKILYFFPHGTKRYKIIRRLFPRNSSKLYNFLIKIIK